jgi:hypothetical protein
MVRSLMVFLYLNPSGREYEARSSLPGIAVRRTASLSLAYDPAIHHFSKKMDTRVKPAYDN